MRMKLFRSLLLAILLFSLLTVTAYAEEATVTGTEVNVRTGPGTSYPIFETLKHGATVSVMNRTNADWYLVSWDGNSGYVFSQFLQITADNSSAEITVSQNASPGYINAMYVCFRSGPGTNHTILGTYSNGKTLTINGTSGAWTAVTIDGKDGYVFSDFVSAGSVSAAVVEQEAYAGKELSPAVAEDELPVVIISDGVAQSASAANTPAIIASATAQSADPDATPQIALDSTTGAQKNIAVPESSDGASSVSTGNAVITGSAVRFRSGPNTTYRIIDTYDGGKVITVTGQSGDWAKVTIDGVSGYIHSDYVRLTTSEENTDSASATGSNTQNANESARPDVSIDGYITASNVRLRESASMTARILTEMNFGTSVKILNQSGDWTKVSRNGQVGYVSSAFVTEGIYEPATKVTSSTGAALGKEIAEYALQYVGSAYKWGGNSPATGFDCSGFVQYVYAHFGYSTSRVANDVTKDGVHVDPSDLQPGDVLCFYSSSSYVGHVGIYIGDNTFVHAANSVSGVVTTDLSTGYYASRGYEIRRII